MEKEIKEKRSVKTLESLLRNQSAIKNMHPSDVANILDEIHYKYEKKFYHNLELLPNDVLGSVLLELPEKYRYEVLENLGSSKLQHAIEELETDDATDLIQEIEEIDEVKANLILDKMQKEDRDEIRRLKDYDEGVAGAFMQTELFDVRMDERVNHAIERLRRLKKEGELENIHQAFIVDQDGKLVGGIWLEDLIIYDFNLTFQEIVKRSDKGELEPIKVLENDDIKEVTKMFEKYDLSVMPVVDAENVLLGRITSDDVYDIIEESATEQLYNLAGLDDDAEREDDVMEISKKRGSWLFVNLLTAIAASLVIGIFEETIQSFVALAVLMPIVASMGGNAGTQTLTVIVRQLALGRLEFDRAKESVRKEVAVSLINGVVFALIMSVVSYFWFGSVMLGVVIALAMVINLFAAGLFGAAIPLLLKKVNIDPAIGSTVLLTTVTDVVGFFCFLGLASWMLL